MKSDHVHDTQPGPAAFTETFKPHRKLLRGGDGLSVEEFLTQPVGHWQRPRVLCRLRRGLDRVRESGPTGPRSVFHEPGPVKSVPAPGPDLQGLQTASPGPSRARNSRRG